MTAGNQTPARHTFRQGNGFGKQSGGSPTARRTINKYDIDIIVMETQIFNRWFFMPTGSIFNITDILENENYHIFDFGIAVASFKSIVAICVDHLQNAFGAARPDSLRVCF